MRRMFGQGYWKRSVQTVVLMLVLLVTVTAGSVPAAQAQSGGLFGDAQPPAVSNQADQGPTVRERFVTVNTSLLLDGQGEPLVAGGGQQFSLNLFPDASYTGVVSNFTDYGGSTYAWAGKLQDVENGYFYLITSGQTFMAHVASTRGIYEVSNIGGDVYRVVQIDQSKFVDEPNDGRDMPAGPAPSAAVDLKAADSAAQIDVMVVYTPAVLTAEGSLANLKAHIALAMTETNQGYANAGITTRLRLVHIQKLTYKETGNIQKDLTRLASKTDGYLDSVHSLRNQYGADMVSLIVNNGGTGGACGIAKAIMAKSTSAFDVVVRSCMTGYYSFGHEFGHLQGARHDMFMDPTLSPFPYGHGYVYVPGLWRTIMAYNNACSPSSCTRLQYWSNPSNTWFGIPMGDSNAQNYAVLNATALTVANFRQTKISADFSSPFTVDAAGWTRVKGTWAVSGGELVGTPGARYTMASIKHAGTYGDFDYAASMYRNTCGNCSNGLVIRGKPSVLSPYYDWLPSFYLAYTQSGYFAVFKLTSTGYAILKKWTHTYAINTGDYNTPEVVANGSALRFYINGNLVWAGSPSGAKTGQVGIMMGRMSTAGGTLDVDGAALINAPTADFMPSADVMASGETIEGGSIFGIP